MQIRIKEDAYKRWCNNRYKGNNQNWGNILLAIQGKLLEVDTTFLFKNQFNTFPIEGVSENGLRIMEEDVEEVLYDTRPGKYRCNWCGKYSTFAEGCPHCGNTENIEKLWRDKK